MALHLKRMSARAVANAQEGLHPDGGGLYLQVTASGAKSWKFRFTLRGRTRDMGLGSLRSVSLADAREAAQECRKLLAEGADPIEARSATRGARRLESTRVMTFRECADQCIRRRQAGWSSHKHAAQWSSSLESYAYAILGNLAVQSVDTSSVMRVLEPIWATKPETANRVRGRIETVLDYATTLGFRSGENPARWRGHLSNLLPARSKVRRVAHHAALPYANVAAFMAQLYGRAGVAAAGLAFTILTAARTSEVTGARWIELDLRNAVWTVPFDRMKSRREHRIPLSEAALDVLQRMSLIAESEFVFPGGRTNLPLSNMAFLTVLRRLGRNDITVHGFRSTFRDWVAEQTAFSSEVAEMALAHAVRGRVEAAYRRGDLFEKRRRLMEAWGRYCCTSPGAE